jgi:hypothetical protein
MVMADAKRKRGDGPKESRNYALSEQARRALKAHAAEWGTPESVIIDYLCCTHLRAVKIVRWSEAVREDAPASTAAGNEDPVETLPITETSTPPPSESRAGTPGQGRGQARRARAAG